MDKEDIPVHAEAINTLQEPAFRQQHQRAFFDMKDNEKLVWPSHIVATVDRNPETGNNCNNWHAKTSWSKVVTPKSTTNLAQIPCSESWSRLIRFQDEQGKIHYGQPILSGEELKHSDVQKGLKAHIIEGDIWANSTVTTKTSTVKKLLSPVTPSVIRCIGLNYRRHAQETGSRLPVKPILFMKPATSVCGPFDPIRVPTVAQDDKIDYEAELAVVIGKECRNVTKENALKYVAGYTICNDVSARNWQLGPNSGGQWNFSKGFDTFAPLGPMVVSSNVIKDPQTLRLGTKLDGRLLQDFTTSDMIFDVSTIVSFLSQGTTLLPGDVIITGTPHGVGYTRNPPVLLKHGNKCEIFIEGIGNIVNSVEYERGQSKL